MRDYISEKAKTLYHELDDIVYNSLNSFLNVTSSGDVIMEFRFFCNHSRSLFGFCYYIW